MVDYLCVAAKRNEKFIDLSVGICVIEYNWEVWRFICWVLISGVKITNYCLGVGFGVGPNFSRACVVGVQGKGCKKKC